MSILIDDGQLDPSTYVCLHTADMEADTGDEAQWLAANPSAGHSRSIDDIRRQHERAKRAPSLMAQFRNLILNQRVSADAGLFDAHTWQLCGAEVNLEAFESGPIYGGLDLSQRSDLTALVLLADDNETEDVHVLCFAWTPAGTLLAREQTDHAPYSVWADKGHLTPIPGDVMRLDHLAERAVSELERYDVDRCYFDRWRIEEFLSHAAEISGGRIAVHHEADEQAVMHPCGQGYRDMSPSIDALEELVLDRRLRHGNNPLLTSAIANSIVMQDPAGNRKLVKQKSAGRIDPAVALAMASKARIDAGDSECLGDSIGVVFADEFTADTE